MLHPLPIHFLWCHSLWGIPPISVVSRNHMKCTWIQCHTNWQSSNRNSNPIVCPGLMSVPPARALVPWTTWTQDVQNQKRHFPSKSSLSTWVFCSKSKSLSQFLPFLPVAFSGLQNRSMGLFTGSQPLSLLSIWNTSSLIYFQAVLFSPWPGHHHLSTEFL